MREIEAVGAAIELANRVLSDDLDLRLIPAWGNAGACEDVPVFVIRREDLGASELVFVPEGTKMIFVRDDAVDVLPERMFDRGEDGLAVAQEAYLAIVLLHELGHIHHGHSGRDAAAVEIPTGLVNIKDTISKSKEYEADAFAADQIKAAAYGDTADSGRLSAGMNLAMALSSISFNITGWLTVDNFGSSGVFAPQVYWDHGYSHPNLALRALVMNALLTKNSDAWDLVAEFDEARQRRPWHVVLKPITTVDQACEIARMLGFEVRSESVSGKTRLHFVYIPSGEHFGYVDIAPGRETRAVREIVNLVGINASGSERLVRQR